MASNGDVGLKAMSGEINDDGDVELRDGNGDVIHTIKQSEAQADQMRAEVEAEGATPFEEAMKLLSESDEADDFERNVDEAPMLWAEVTYEEGTSGPLINVAGVLIDDHVGVTVVHPDTGVATTIGDRFIVRVDIQAIMDEDEDDNEDKDALDTSADRFRA